MLRASSCEIELNFKIKNPLNGGASALLPGVHGLRGATLGQLPLHPSYLRRQAVLLPGWVRYRGCAAFYAS